MNTRLLFAEKIRQLREDSGQLQRKVAAALDVDAGLYSKIERGERPAKREQVIALASIFNTDEKELLTLWLADQIYGIVGSEQNANNVLTLVSKSIAERQ